MLFIRLGKDLLFVKLKDVKRRSEKKAIYSHIWEFTMGKSHSSATLPIAIWASLPRDISPTIREDTQVKDPTFARCAVTNSWDQVHLKFTWEDILVKDHTNAISAIEVSQKVATLKHIWRLMKKKCKCNYLDKESEKTIASTAHLLLSIINKRREELAKVKEKELMKRNPHQWVNSRSILRIPHQQTQREDLLRIQLCLLKLNQELVSFYLKLILL